MNRIVPASPIQKQFWTLQQLNPQSPAYHIVSLFKIEGMLDTKALHQSIQTIVDAHEIFRTQFNYNKNGLQQVILPELAINLIQENILPSIYLQNDQLRVFIQSHISKPFDLQKDPLIRNYLFKADTDKHILLFVFNHIICDLRTKDLFSSELKNNYHVLLTGKKIKKNEQVQYSVVSEWYTKWFLSDGFKNARAYWDNHLKNANSYLNFPLDKKRSSLQSLNGTIENIVFSPTLTTKINAFSKEMVSRNYLIMLAAYYILLSRYTGQKNITIGVPLSNRRQKYFEQVFGCCVNILPISVDLSDNPSFLTLLKCVRMAMLGSHRNQEIPFEQILHLKKTERNLDYNPIFQTGFTFEHPMKLSLHDLKVESVYCHHGGAQLDLFVTFWENETGQIEGSFEYNTDLFNKDTIERLQKHYLQLLSEVINNKDKTIEEINIVPLSERHQMCYEWNQTVVPLPHKTFIQLFEESVRNCSKKTALICNNHQIQYGKLCEKVNQFASFLIESGIQKETVVALCLDRSVEMVTAILALFKVNCAYLPLDPNFPKQRLNYMLSHSECPCVITEEKYSTFFSEKSLKIINFNKEFKKIENRSIKNYDYTVDLNHIAYIIYTSGSTGKPKGVQITQGNMLNFLLSMKKKPGLTSQDTLAAVTTISFDISVLELFLPLIVGATTLIVGKEDTIDGDKLSSLLKQHQATIMQATPSTWRLLLSASWQCGSSFKILCGGEKFPLDLMKKLTEMSDNVWNMYGPTETTVWSTCFKMNVEDEKVSIGKPIDNTFVYVLDKYLNPVPVGVSGELWIGGLGVAKGYLKNAELSSERFIKNPFDKNEGSVMYGTGDLCRFLPDGTIEVLNRIDNQVKIRGFRIEPAEIEINLKEHSLVDDAVVTACDDEFGNKQLVGFIVTKKSIDDKLIKEFLKNKLPSYMIPDYFIVLKKFPLTSNGKVDIRALSQQKRQPILGKKLVTESENDLVSKLLQIWSGILRNRKIGLEDNFFDIGGNSLLIIEVKRQLLEKLNCDVSITTLFQYPTITTLANYISPEEHKGCSNNSINKRVMQKKKALSLRRNTVLRRKRNRQ